MPSANGEDMNTLTDLGPFQGMCSWLVKSVHEEQAHNRYNEFDG